MFEFILYFSIINGYQTSYVYKIEMTDLYDLKYTSNFIYREG